MRVVFLTHNYPRWPGDVPGGFLHPLAVALRERGTDVRVVAPSDAGHGGEERLDGVPVRRVRYASAEREVLAYTGNMAGAIRTPAGLHALAGLIRAFTGAVRDELRGCREGLVHAHWWFPAAVSVPPRCPLVITCHGTDVRWLGSSRLARVLGRRVLRRAAVVTTVSRFLADRITEHTGRVIGDSEIQPMPLLEVDRPPSVGGGGILLLGRLSAQKRLDLAFAAIARLCARGWTGVVTVVGDGPERARLKTTVGALGLAGVVDFVGAVPPGEVPRYLARADACLMTARHEGLGLAAAEALLQGVPVVACSDGGGVLDVVPAEGGGRVVAPDPEAIAAALEQVLASPEARAAARRIGELWRERLSADHAADRCLEWYTRALHG